MADLANRVWVDTTAGPWALDTSTGSEILVKGGCSVIEGEDARYLLRLIAADTSTPAPDPVARLEEAARAFASWDHCWPGNINMEAACRDIRAALAAMETSHD